MGHGCIVYLLPQYFKFSWVSWRVRDSLHAYEKYIRVFRQYSCNSLSATEERRKYFSCLSSGVAYWPLICFMCTELSKFHLGETYRKMSLLEKIFHPSLAVSLKIIRSGVILVLRRKRENFQIVLRDNIDYLPRNCITDIFKRRK